MRNKRLLREASSRAFLVRNNINLNRKKFLVFFPFFVLSNTAHTKVTERKFLSVLISRRFHKIREFTVTETETNKKGDKFF